MNFWLMKSEPDVYSIDDLKRDNETPWSGVRNYQARNFMRDSMKVGDLILFYHSNAQPMGIAGLGSVAKSAQTDITALDPKSPYFDPASTKENPRWMCVHIKFLEKFSKFLSLEELKSHKALKDLLILRRGIRLSITPVEQKEFQLILKLCTSKNEALTSAEVFPETL